MAADKLEEDIRAGVMRFEELPSLGHRRRGLTIHDLWFHAPRKNYLIVYRLAENLEILRILHGARDAVQELD